MQNVNLQFHGKQKALPVEELKAGMTVMWNGGVTTDIMGVIPSKSGKTFQIQYMDGHLDRRKMRKGRLVAIA